ncbi:hypothetical protein J3R82DRAFT_22 [Butyriboletus roseoflavus]|nr:hypothetical protein J3R82DRAFT_22 [Butyriboletus roseoflavus]
MQRDDSDIDVWSKDDVSFAGSTLKARNMRRSRASETFDPQPVAIQEWGETDLTMSGEHKDGDALRSRLR